ncbi:sensor histidine kinase [Natronoglycomyces albus]|uniref:histidine kinase n=1 Tax=Natronoglycomyces albus TaxID=2811108 RepID=A0A895XTB8_9ACTN|nr:sensor histidine kinase [Natronoglycomyces albus]QSB06733.1 sensor histidine kinase [Natronoglycomyces albus]
MLLKTHLHHLRAWLRDRPVAADSLLAFGLWALVGLPLTLLGSEISELGVVVPLITMTLGMATVAFRRVALWPATVALMAISVLAVALSPEWIAAEVFAYLVMTYTAAAYRKFPEAVLLSLTLWTPPVALSLILSPPEEQVLLITAILIVTNWMTLSTAFFFGWVTQNRRTRVKELLDRAEVAEANQRGLVAQSVADERRRIARELHDVVAHHVAAMGVMASGAQRVLDTDLEQAREALEVITDTSRTAMQEMRAILEVLRNDADDDASQMMPQPGLESLQTLVSQSRQAGLPVKMTVKGRPFAPPVGVGLAIYRIVQEALTNTLKHGGKNARAGIVVNYNEKDLTVEVADSGQGTGALDGTVGHGLVGMRERVSLYGGSLWLGPRPGGGFQVRATFPSNPQMTPTSAESRRESHT